MKGNTKKETHFRALIVSDAFKGLTAVQRHKKVFALLDEEFKNGLHALSLDLKTVDQYSNKAEE